MKTSHASLVAARIVPFAVIAAFPLLTLAVSNLCELISAIVYYFNVGIYLIIGLATVVFIWNVFNYFFKADGGDKKEAGLYVMYSVIGFFVILSFWGLVNIVKNTLNLDTRVPTSFSSGGGAAVGSSCGASTSGGSAANAFTAPKAGDQSFVGLVNQK
jgi:hypothetical protein